MVSYTDAISPGGRKWLVLILIVVEDGLVHSSRLTPTSRTASLNPYCSGRWSRTLSKVYFRRNPISVLILIVVEDGLVPLKGMNPRIQNKVLILIVVEDGLVPFKGMNPRIQNKLS